MGTYPYNKDTLKSGNEIMGNSSSATKLAIAKLAGSDLPDFVPRSTSEQVAKLVRECILQSDEVKSLKITTEVHELFDEHLKQYQTPRYTVPQYLLMVLNTVSTISILVRQHNSGTTSDKEFVTLIKGDAKQNDRVKIPRKVGRKKG